MIPNQFDYYAPTSLDQAVALLRDNGDRAKLLAGGHSLLPLMKLRVAAPDVLIDITGLSGLRDIRVEGDRLLVGGLSTYAQIAPSPAVRESVAVLAEAAAAIGDQQVRNRGTIGGNIAHADPASDLPAVVLALEAEIVVIGPAGQRTIAARDFFQGPFATALGADEILTEVRVPILTRGTGGAYAKCENRASGYALVGVAAVISVSNGSCSAARIGITGAGASATRAAAAEAALVGSSLDDASITAAVDTVPNGIDLMSDLHASTEYRAALLKVYARRAIQSATAAARRG